MGKELKRQSGKEDMQMANKYMKMLNNVGHKGKAN
jgi:hypothetical protein